MKKYLCVFSILTAFCVYAQQEIAVADGSSSGIYKSVFAQMSKVIGSDQITFTEIASHGSLENIRKVIDNEADICFVHSDVIQYLSKTEDVSNIKTLVALFGEDVHFIAKNQPYVYDNGIGGIGAKSKSFVQISDLEGFSIGASGGGYITANVIRLNGEIAYKVQKFETGNDVMAALNNGTIVAAVFVGASPLPNIKELGSTYKLLSIGDVTLSKLKSVYHRSTISYSGINGGAPVQTVAADCLLLARVKKTPKFANALKLFRTKFCDQLSELQETRGTHKAWQQVDCSNHGKWAWYDFPATPVSK